MASHRKAVLVVIVGAVLLGTMLAGLGSKQALFVEHRQPTEVNVPPEEESHPLDMSSNELSGPGLLATDEESSRRPPDARAAEETFLDRSPDAKAAEESSRDVLPDVMADEESYRAHPPDVRVAEETSPDSSSGPRGGISLGEWELLKQRSTQVAMTLPTVAGVRSPEEATDAFGLWLETQHLPEELDITVRLYMFVEGTNFWEVEDHVGDKHVHARACKEVSDIAEDRIAQFNCLARQAVEEGADYVGSIDPLELDSVIRGDGPSPGSSHWLLRAVAALLKDGCDERLYVPEVRHFGIAGRGAQWRKQLSLEQEYVREHFQDEIEEAQSRGEENPVCQYRPLNQFSQSFLVHAQHVRAAEGVFHPDVGNIRDGLVWLTRIYTYTDTYRVDDWPEAYGSYDDFMKAVNATFQPEQSLSDQVALSTTDMYRAKIAILIEKYGILGCEAFDEMMTEVDSFTPPSTGHSTKKNINTGYLNGQKVFIYALTQGGPVFRRRATARNLHSLLMLHQSDGTGQLVAFCPKDRRTAVKFIESRGDYDSGTQNATCEFRLRASMDLVYTLQEIHKLGLIQCDWKVGQWIFNEEDRLVLVDMDTLEHVPTDCEQAEAHRHPAVDNFGQVNEDSRRWPKNYTHQILTDQFLMEDDDVDYPRFDFRFDTYKLGGAMYFHKAFDYHGACEPFITEAKKIIANVKGIYPPPLEEVLNQLQEFLDLVHKHDELEQLRRQTLN